MLGSLDPHDTIMNFRNEKTEDTEF